jgi:hypothetical protein
MIRGRHDNALSAGLLQEDQERVQDPVSFADVATAAMSAERVELVEQVDRALRCGGIEHRPELASPLAEVSTQQAGQPDGEQRQRQLVGVWLLGEQEDQVG